ncbi:MAG: ribulose-phosphate 3-epimerase [Candidatus Tectomicrobia bacterium]|uniref:Ribulose-phosphate 3-epimerase n=1 Tax=Tectimicrobiota bacterium TaxID=2528274 RepID=A0A932MN63_UNCTE|nr:ribulose-phosphate 3-epimerase [Candidatus Tectomicrobia bacterium]
MTRGKIRIAPSLLACRFERMGEEIEAVRRAGADWLHFDVMDGRFVPNISVGPMGVAAARRVSPDFVLDVHLMIADPDRYLEDFVRAGADLVTVHVEAAGHLHRTVQAIHALGALAGATLNPGTPLCALDPVLGDVDLVLIMSVNPGFGGQKFIPSALERVREARRMLDARKSGALLEVDGGVTAGNAAALREAGADVLVAGTAVFGSPDYAGAIREIRGGEMDTENNRCPVCLVDKPRIEGISNKDAYKVDCHGKGCGRFSYSGPAKIEKLKNLTLDEREVLKAYIVRKNQDGIEPCLDKMTVDAILAGTAG